MKLVKIIIQHILIPLFTALFVIVVGLSAAGISGLIEYCVFKEMFVSNYQQLIPSATIALTLVIVLEFTKIYLHFLSEKLDFDSSIKGRTKWLLYFLISISAMCTIIFGVNTFHLASYDSEAILLEVEAINDTLENDIQHMKEKYYQEYENALAPYLSAKILAEEAIEKFDPNGLTRSQREDKLNALREAVSNTTAEYRTAEAELYDRYQNNVINETEKMTAQAQEKIQNISDISSPEIAAKYDNPVMARFLTVLSQTLFHANSYSRNVYLIITVLFSILIALLLECIISMCFGFLSFPLEKLTDTSISITPHLQQWCNNLILTFLKAFCAAFISVIIIISVTASMDKLQFLASILSCGVSIMLIQHFVTSKTAEQESHGRLIYAVRDSILEGVIAFMGYIILGFLFGNDALTLDITTIAVGIGSTLASCIAYVPKYLIVNAEKLGISDIL